MILFPIEFLIQKGGLVLFDQIRKGNDCMEQLAQILGNDYVTLIFEALLQVMLTALGVLLALWYESKADPKLSLESAPTKYNVYPDNREPARFTYVRVKNAGLYS